MNAENTSAVTQILQAVSDGEESASERLLPVVYEQLRELARARMRHEPSEHTLDATALVHEAYLRLVGGQKVSWSGRAHFFGAAARAMRRILLERARRQRRIKYGGALQRVRLQESQIADQAPCEELLALDEALDRLDHQDTRKAEIVMLRYFAGLTIGETAQALEISPSTVKKEWNFARAWLYDQISDSDHVLQE